MSPKQNTSLENQPPQSSPNRIYRYCSKISPGQIQFIFLQHDLSREKSLSSSTFSYQGFPRALQEGAQQQGADLRAATANTITSLLQGGEPGTSHQEGPWPPALELWEPWLWSLLPGLTHRCSQVEFPKSSHAGPRAANPNASANDISSQVWSSEERPNFSSESVLRLSEALCPNKGDDPVGSQLQQSDQCKCWQKGSTVVHGAQEKAGTGVTSPLLLLQRQKQRVLLLQPTPISFYSS